MLKNHQGHSQSVRTAYFVMPLGKLFSTYSFIGDNCEQINPQNTDDVMTKLRKGYAERVKEISEGKIETADNAPVKDLDYTKAGDVYPLEKEGKTKVENKYSDYKCFTI